MNKKGVAKWLKIVLVILLIIAIILAVVVLVLILIRFQKPEAVNIRTETNPIENLTDQQAQERLNKTFVRYLLYQINADELHKPPLSSDTPKINIDVSDLDFGAEVVEGAITVNDDSVSEPDIKIITTRSEAIKMLRDKNYIAESFNSGASQIELLASKTKLFSKGYLKLYTDITGEEAEIEE